MTLRTPKRDERGRWASEGRRLLLALRATRTAVQVAKACGCAHQAITQLANGETQAPSLRVGLALEQFGIAAGTWFQPPALTTAIASPLAENVGSVTEDNEDAAAACGTPRSAA